MPGPYGPTTFDSPHPLDIEITIMEVIDNSIDAGASDIHVDIKQDSVVAESFQVRVYDNGSKIFEENWTQENIDSAFNIEIDPNDPEILRDEEAIGKFHVGMKIAPLSKFNFVSMFTLSQGNLLQKHGMYPEYTKIRINPNLIYGGTENPFNEVPEHINVEQIQTYFNNNNMNTCVMMSHPRMDILTNINSDISCLREFRKHIKKYLGVVYQKYLEDGDFEIKVIGIQERDGGGNVIPLDPFWSNYTPEKITQFKDTLVVDSEIAEVANLARFGTLKTRRIPIEIDNQEIVVEGFIVPHRTSRQAFNRYWEDGKYGEEHTKVEDSFKVNNSGSEKLASTNMGGFFFYRGKRCINFGGDLSNNQGFFDLINPQNSNWCWRLRIKIEYDENLDHLLKLHPNKKGYISIDESVWQGIKEALSTHVGGESFARPFNQQRAFVLWNDNDNQFNFTNASNQRRPREPANFSYDACINCGYEIHEDNDLCPLVECAQCGNAGEGCSILECNHVCTFCEIEDCPGERECDLNCLYCDEIVYHNNDEECENYCNLCGSFECTCPEEDDGDGDGNGNGNGDGDGDGDGNEEQNWAPSSMRYHEEEEEITLMLNKNDRERNIQFLTESLELLEINNDELI